MKSRFAKIAFLGLVYLGLYFVEACSICDCPTVQYPFFDYRKIRLETNTPEAGSSFWINIAPDSIKVVAQARPGLNLVSAAYACSCDADGDQGDKFAPLSVDVFADRDFNDTLPAGASLRSLFFGVTQGDILTKLTADYHPDRFYSVTQSHSINTIERPKFLGEPYHFRIQWVKSNGDTLEAETAPVVFN